MLATGKRILDVVLLHFPLIIFDEADDGREELVA
jgi:hypothetical protein